MNKNELLRNFAIKAKKRLIGEKFAPNPKIKVIENNDAEFESKVEYLLSQEEVVTNPIKYLMDEKIMKNMSDADRERYLLATLDKYCSLRAKSKDISSVRDFCI